MLSGSPKGAALAKILLASVQPKEKSVEIDLGSTKIKGQLVWVFKIQVQTFADSCGGFVQLVDATLSRCSACRPQYLAF